MKKWYFVVAISFLTASLVFIYTQKNMSRSSPDKRALFSWSHDTDEKSIDELLTVMKDAQLNTLFQSFSIKEGLDYEMILTSAIKENIDVYALTGTPEWALEEDGESMKERTEYIARINDNLPDGMKIKGIVMDVEPYLMDDFKGNEKRIMEAFISGLRETYEAAKENELELAVCIPYYYDQWNLEEELEKLVYHSDFLVVMNYYRDKEIEHMEYEASLAKINGKEIMTTFELQKPGRFGLTEKNTYYGMSLKKVHENYEDIRDYFLNQKVSMGIHEYKSLKEMLENE